MTKVYGTGPYDFTRHHVAEYPFEAKPGSALPSSLTLLDIQRDRLTMIAADDWSKTLDASQPKKPFDPELVKEIYRTELSVGEGQRRVVSPQKLVLNFEIFVSRECGSLDVFL